ncbi:transposase [Streptosporangium sp. NBC_01469]|uniref:transposase n=1 Tax=Streptosporangium sp. NBC_01469 TaxID=2903898 RepID=UPI003FCE7831
MGKRKPRPRRSFTPEFKAEIVELCRRGDRSIRQVAADFDLTETAVRAWVRQAEGWIRTSRTWLVRWGRMSEVSTTSAPRRETTRNNGHHPEKPEGRQGP